MADATHYVEPPRRSPRRGGIRSVAEFRTADSRLGLGGIVEYTSPGCGLTVGKVELCYPSPMADQAEKTRTGISTLEAIGTVFGAYAGVECWAGGSDFEADARRLLADGVDRALEAALNTWVAADTVGATLDSWSDAVAVSDDWADDHYVGLPVLLMNRGDAVRAHAERALDSDGTGSLWTPNGTPVIASAAFTAGTVASAGGITVLEGAVTAFKTNQWELNTEYAIAEQVFAILVDCNYLETWDVTVP